MQKKQHGYVQTANKRDYDVLVMDTPIDNHYMQQLEMKLEKVSFKRVDADVMDKLIEKRRCTKTPVN